VAKEPGHGIEQPLLSSADVKERVELAVLVLHNSASIACSRLNVTVHSCFVSYMPDALMLPQTIVKSACHLFILFHSSFSVVGETLYPLLGKLSITMGLIL
jgi:hypothetical protein